MVKFSDDEIEKFQFVHHVHIGNALTVCVNPYGKMMIGTIGGELDGQYMPERHDVLKVSSELTILGMTPGELRELANFFEMTAKDLEGLDTQ